MKALSDQAAAAKEIRKELKAAFPVVKFSIISDSFAGGNSVSISWVDGPRTKDVEAITGKYQYGHFDGMTDCYEYSNSNKTIPQAKYVQTSRTFSDIAKKRAESEIVKQFGLPDFSDKTVYSKLSQWPDQVLWRHLSDVSLAA
jgi:hypothetical protein